MAQRGRNNPFPTWALWMIGAVTVLAAAIVILSIVLGLQVGQRQLEMENRQQIGIALQQAMDFRAEGNLEGALHEYQRVLVLDPGNDDALLGIENLLRAASEGSPAVAPATAVPGPVVAPAPAATDTPPPVEAVVADPAEDLWQQALAAYEAGDWQQAIDLLQQVQTTSPAFNTEQVLDTLFNGYVNLAAEKDNADNLEEALQLVDKALELRPESMELRRARTLAAKYLDVLTYFGADWEQAVELLRELYDRDAGYRDVEVRLQEALVEYGDVLAADDDHCAAVTIYNESLDLGVLPGSIAKRDEYQSLCQGGDVAAVASNESATVPAAQAPVAETQSVAVPAEPTTAPVEATTATEAPVEPAAVAPTATAAPPPPTAAPAATSLSGGRIFYSAQNPVDGRSRVFIQNVGDSSPPGVLVEDAQQAAMRPDGTRVVFRSVRDDMLGLTSLDPGTGLTLRFSNFSEDILPSWSNDASRIVFASNRAGDRRWRIYVSWADEGSEATNLGFGEAPKWHPTADRIAFRGCDESGNRCGLWTMNGGGGDRVPLTTVTADFRPSWSPTGQYVVFMSDARDGNPELYRVTVATGEVLRLTENPSTDAVPVVSPDGSWVAFLSDRDGVWRIWGVPIGGGAAQIISEVAGSIGNWYEHDLQWVD